MKKFTLIAAIAFFALAGFNSCSKSDTNATLKVNLTDAPGDYDQVLVDIQDVQIHAASDESQGEWVSLAVKKGVYNLLDFRNGMDTLLATLELPAGTISQMRLVLGTGNKIMVNGTLYDLEAPAALQSGLKFTINAHLIEGVTYELFLDFDAGHSIVENGNGGYLLKPVIHTYTEATSGAISGVVDPVEALPYIYTIAGTDTIGTIAADDGKFLLRGVPAGTYTVNFKPVGQYPEMSVDNVNVTLGEVTAMDTVFFAVK